MSQQYDYNKTPVMPERLAREIVSAGLPSSESVTYNQGETPNNLHITFASALDSGQQTTLATVVSSHNGTSGSVVVPTGAIIVNGARLSYVSGTQVTLGTAGKASHIIDLVSGLQYGWTGFFTIDTAVSGVNGLASDESITDGDWLAIFVIADRTRLNPIAGLASFKANPTLPAGYDISRRVGVCRLNASDQIIRFLQQGANNERHYWFDALESSLVILNAGSAVAWTEIDLSAWRPPASLRMKLRIEVLSSGGGNVMGMLRPHGSIVATSVYRIRTLDGKAQEVYIEDFVCGLNGNIDYMVDVGTTSMTIYSCGFSEEL